MIPFERLRYAVLDIYDINNNARTTSRFAALILVKDLILLPPQRRFPLQRMRLRRRLLILPPNLNRLISLSANQSQSRLVKRAGKDPALRIQGTRLRRRIQRLIPISRLPVPKGHGSVVAAGEEDVVFVDAEGVDDGVLTVEILHEGTLGAFPLLDAAGAAAGEGPFDRMLGQGPDAFFVMGEHAHGFSRREVPEADGGVEGGGDDLGFATRLAGEVRDRLFVSAEDVHVASGSHVPYPCHAVSAAGHEDVEGRVQGEGVDAGEVAVVVADHFVGFEVPAFDHFVLAAREEVRMAWGDCQASDCGYVTRECQS